LIRHLAIDATPARWRGDVGPYRSMQNSRSMRAGYVFHNGGARVMGSAQALPERIDKDTAERVAGRHFCSTDFDALATQTPGFISREQLLEAARVRNLSFTLREKSQKKFDFGFVAEEKDA
jgi:hypothetical protein